jgi:hypothetical protein
MTHINLIDIYLDDKIKHFEKKLSTYIDIYNKKQYHLQSQDQSQDQDIENTIHKNYDQDHYFTHPSPSLERIGNIEILYKNFNNNNKKISKKLRYTIYKLDILLIIETCQYILNSHYIFFDFINYNYDLYNVIEIDNMYIIHQKLKGLIFKFEGPCIIYILIKDKLFIHYY